MIYVRHRPCETRRNESRDQSDLKLRDVKCGRGPVGKCSQVVFASNRRNIIVKDKAF